MSAHTAPPATVPVDAPGFSMARVMQYGSVTNDMNPLHVDPDFAANTRFGAPIVHGLFVLAPVWEAFERAFGRAAMVDAEAEIRFVAPTFVETAPVYAVTLEGVVAGCARYAVEITDAAGKVAVSASMTLAVPDL